MLTKLKIYEPSLNIISTIVLIFLSAFPVKSYSKEEGYRIAILLPLSGKHQEIGRNLLDAAIMSASEYGDSNLILTPFDTGESQVQAKLAAENAWRYKPEVVIGPVFSDITENIAPIFTQNDITVVSLSSDVFVAGNGVYIMGFDPAEQVRKIIEYSHNSGIKKFSAFLPEGAFGSRVNLSLRKKLEELGLEEPKVAWYSASDEQLSARLKYLTELADSEKKKSYDNKTEALLIPEGGRISQIIISRLYGMNIGGEKFQLLGTGEWESEEVVFGGKAEGALFATSMTQERIDYENNFEELFGYKPIRISSLAYDAVKMVAEIEHNNDNIRSEITRKKGFDGTNGKFRFNKNGLISRNLDIVSVTRNGFEVVE